jgi:hypothetical protein
MMLLPANLTAIKFFSTFPENAIPLQHYLKPLLLKVSQVLPLYHKALQDR